MLSSRNNPVLRRCIWCNASFVTTNRRKQYCSEKCKSSRHANQYQIKKLELIPSICAYCGKEYKRPNRNVKQKYCSSDCAKLSNAVANSRGRYVIFERDNFTCFYCGKKSYTDGAELHADHVIPVSSGGLDRADNLVTACKDCNLEKSARQIRNTAEIFIEIKRRNASASLPNDMVIKLPGSDGSPLIFS